MLPNYIHFFFTYIFRYFHRILFLSEKPNIILFVPTNIQLMTIFKFSNNILCCHFFFFTDFFPQAFTLFNKVRFHLGVYLPSLSFLISFQLRFYYTSYINYLSINKNFLSSYFQDSISFICIFFSAAAIPNWLFNHVHFLSSKILFLTFQSGASSQSFIADPNSLFTHKYFLSHYFLTTFSIKYILLYNTV